MHSFLRFLLFAFLIDVSSLQSTQLMRDKKLIWNYMEQSSELKRQHSPFPYRKFQELYQRLNVCGLIRVKKLQLCELFLGNEPFGYVFNKEEWADVSCAKVEIELEKSQNDNSVPRKRNIHLVNCPRPYRVELLTFVNLEKNVPYASVRYFVSTAPAPNSVILLYSHAGKILHIRPYVAALNLPLAPLQHAANDWRRLRFSMKTLFCQQPLFQMYLPPRIPKYVAPNARVPKLVEFKLKKIVESMKLNGLPYRKFTLRFDKINVCGLTVEKLIAYCKHAFENFLFGYQVRSSYDESTACQRHLISFNFHEVENSVYMYLIQCHMSGPAPKNQYFLSTGDEKDNLYGYVKLNPHEEILPDAYFLKIVKH